jgi:hypothetical protein
VHYMLYIYIYIYYLYVWEVSCVVLWSEDCTALESVVCFAGEEYVGNGCATNRLGELHGGSVLLMYICIYMYISVFVLRREYSLLHFSAVHHIPLLQWSQLPETRTRASQSKSSECRRHTMSNPEEDSDHLVTMQR